MPKVIGRRAEASESSLCNSDAKSTYIVAVPNKTFLTLMDDIFHFIFNYFILNPFTGL